MNQAIRFLLRAVLALAPLVATAALALLAPTAFAQPVRGVACDPAQRFDNSTCRAANGSGMCRRVAGSCGQVYGPMCLDDPNSGRVTKNLPLETNRLCNQFCSGQVGQCEPAPCNADADCRSIEACTRGWCQVGPRAKEPAAVTTPPPASPGASSRLAVPDKPRRATPDLQRKLP
jgi:hypothetical protein